MAKFEPKFCGNCVAGWVQVRSFRNGKEREDSARCECWKKQLEEWKSQQTPQSSGKGK